MGKKKSSKAKPKSSDVTPWIIRGVVAAVLVIAAVVVLRDFQAKGAAKSSYAAVKEKVTDEPGKKSLLKSQVRPLLAGAPRSETVDPKSLDKPDLVSAERFDWPGVFRTYSLTIGYGPGDDPEVELVKGLE
jgi:hypothetical protein